MNTLMENETRQQIISESYQLFMEHGYRAVSTRMIARACGITQPALYHHFCDKEELYKEVLCNYLQRLETELGNTIAEHTDIKDCLIAVAETIMRSNPNDLTQMFHDIRVEINEENKKTIDAAFMRAYPLQIARVFEQGIQKGTIESDPTVPGNIPVVWAYLFLSMLNHHGASKIMCEKTMEEAKREKAELVVHIFLHGVVKK
ncbi:MAG: TetR/AcrR family transcriptional regulator [Bacilli bacterium]